MRTWKKRLLSLGFAAGVIASFTGHARAVSGVQLEVGRFALEKGVFNTIFAKELCSCLFVDGLTVEQCQAQDNLPAISHSLVDLTIDPDTKTVSSTYKGRETINRFTESIGIGDLVTIGGSATAKVDPAHPEYGCVLTKLPSDP